MSVLCLPVSVATRCETLLLIEVDINVTLLRDVSVLVAFVRLSRMPHQYVIQNACLLLSILFVIVSIGGTQ
jgi:hypothetical protein